MINGVHMILYSLSPDLDRAFFEDVLGLPNVDAGDGWLIFGVPPSEIAVHPSDESGGQEIFLMCKSASSFVEEMAKRGLNCDPVQDRGWGLLTRLTLPGGGKIGVYEPRHARPKTP